MRDFFDFILFYFFFLVLLLFYDNHSGLPLLVIEGLLHLIIFKEYYILVIFAHKDVQLARNINSDREICFARNVQLINL